MNNSNDMLPLGRGLAEQKDYVRRTLDLIASTTGVRPIGWSSPSVYSNADTMQAMAAEGITYNLDQMDSDTISRLKTPDGVLVLLPYPTVTVDMGQFLARMKSPNEIETLWLDYVLELANEARADPAREATTVVIGLHPFVVGTPDGAAATALAKCSPKHTNERYSSERMSACIPLDRRGQHSHHSADGAVNSDRLP